MVKFMYTEKAREIFTLLLSYVVPIKSKVKILQNFVAFSEYMNFTKPYHTMGPLSYEVAFEFYLNQGYHEIVHVIEY